MTKESDIADRIKKLEARIDKYDKLGLKVGWFVMGIICFGAVVSMGFDKFVEKLFLFIKP